MRAIPYSKLSPCGNDTIFLHVPPPAGAQALGGRALALLGGEQAGFADLAGRVLFMAGGEFCANACRAFGALLDLEAGAAGPEPREYEMTVSGQEGPVSLLIWGGLPAWTVRAGFRLMTDFSATEAGRLCRMPGIWHLLLNSGEFPENPGPAARKLALRHGLAAAPAWGLVWHRQKGEQWEIHPYVEVRGAGCGMLESSCGSASLALCLALGGAPISVLQPSGQILKAAAANGLAFIEGPVSLISRGEIWL